MTNYLYNIKEVIAVIIMESYLTLPLDHTLARRLSENAKDYAFTKGIAMKYKDLTEDCVTFAPFCLIPSPFPRVWFESAKSLQPTVNFLMHKVAHDHDFLTRSLERTIESDEFTGKIFKIYKTVRKEGISQDFDMEFLRPCRSTA